MKQYPWMIAFVVLGLLPAAAAGEAGYYVRIKSGTGFYVNRQYIVTNQHVVDGCDKVLIRAADAPSAHEASVKVADAQHDLAILETDSPPQQIAPLRFNIEGLRTGDHVLVVGYPGEAGLRGEYRLAGGQVQDITHNIPGANPDHFYISDIVEHGNSGGPVLDDSGNVIGVVVAKTVISMINASTQEKISEQRLGVVISLNTLKQFLTDHGVYFQWTESGLLYTDNYIETRARDYLVNIQCRLPEGAPN